MKIIRYFVILIVSIFIINTSLTAQSLHAIIMADTFDEGIGKSVAKDFDKMSILMSDISSATNLSLKTYYYNGDDCSKNKLLQVLSRLNFAPNDVVIFYYSGHGGRSVNDKSKFPQLYLGGNSDNDLYPLYKIAETIKSKTPRFSLIMADACNSFVPGLSAKGFPIGKSVISKSVSNLYSSLFLKYKGQVIVTSSKIGETSTALYEGGAFSLCFQIELNKLEKTGETPTWSSLLESVKAETYRVGQHTPFYEINLLNNGTSTSNEASNLTVALNSDNFITTLINIANDKNEEMSRINLSKITLKNYFESDKSKVEVIGRNGTTVLAVESAGQFMERISTAYKLINFTTVEVLKNSNGKIKSLKIHEIYKQ